MVFQATRKVIPKACFSVCKAFCRGGWSLGLAAWCSGIDAPVAGAQGLLGDKVDHHLSCDSWRCSENFILGTCSPSHFLRDTADLLKPLAFCSLCGHGHCTAALEEGFLGTYSCGLVLTESSLPLASAPPSLTCSV